VPERGRGVSQALLVQDARALVAAVRDVELALAVHAVEAVEAGLVQKDEARRQVHAALRPPRALLVVEAGAFLVLRGQVTLRRGREALDERLRLVADHLV